MQVLDTKLKEVKLIQLESFEDHRGHYVESYNERMYLEAGIDIKFVQDDFSLSRQNVLRGLHGDDHTWKLVSCPVGKLMLAVVNCDQSSENFGQWETFVLSESNRSPVLVPPKFGNGHLVLSERAMFMYKQSSYYSPTGQFSYRYDDPRFNIWWPIQNPILSRRDEQGAYVD